MTIYTSTGPHRLEGAGTLGPSWSYLVATYRSDDGMLVLYRNGESENSIVVGTGPENRTLLAATDRLHVGVDLVGSLDEVRISSLARPPGWVELQHASMSDALLEFGPPEAR